MAWYNSIKDLGKSLGDVVKTAAAVGSVVPGPWTPYAKAITIGSNLFGGGSKSDTAQQAQDYTQQGADAQMAYQNAALKNYQNNMDRQIAISTADKQTNYDINKGQFLSNQQNILPYQIASLSALQALPQLQQLLGVPAYSIPTTISQYTPPDVNYLNEYRKTGNALTDTSNGAATTATPTDANTVASAGVQPTRQTGAIPAQTPTDIGYAKPQQRPTNSGIRANIKVPDNVAQQLIDNGQTGTRQEIQQIMSGSGSNSAGGTSNTRSLTPYAGSAYNMENSPIYQWQKQQADEALNAQLSAAGLSDGTYAQRELTREHQGLAANERNRVIPIYRI